MKEKERKTRQANSKDATRFYKTALFVLSEIFNAN